LTRNTDQTRRMASQRLTIRVKPGPMEPERARDRLDQVLTGDRERDTRNVALLLETVHAYDSSKDIGDYLDRVVDMIVGMTGADRGILLLRDDDPQARVVSARDRDQQTIVQLTQFSHSVPRKVLQTGESICLVDTGESDVQDLGKSVRALDLKTIMSVPIQGRQGPVGVMYVDSRFKTREFSDADLHFFEAICHQAALAIEQARLTQYVVETEGLAAIGGMTKRLIDELSSPAKVLQGSAAMLRSFDLGADDVKRIGGEVDTFVQQIFSMLTSAQEYARVGNPMEPGRVDVEDFVRVVLTRMMPLLKERGVEIFVGAKSSASVEVDAELMEFAFGAVVRNAVEAMPEGGTLTARIRVLDDGAVAVQLSDTGCGVVPEHLEQMFEPFETYGKHHHVGLGLSTARSIVERHGGTIDATSDEGKGTDVTIVLPVAGPMGTGTHELP